MGLDFDATDGYSLTGTDAVRLGNGKVSFLTGDASDSATALDVQQSLMTRSVDVQNGRVGFDNTVPSVSSGRWCVLGADKNELAVDAIRVCELNMRSAVHRLEAQLSDPDVSVDLDRYAVGHLPYCTVQSMLVRSAASYAVDVQHFVTLPRSDFRLTDVKFSGNMIRVDTVDRGPDVRYILLADGRLSDSGLPYAAAVMYTMDDPTVTSMLGFEMLTQAGREVGGVATFGVEANYPSRIHALTCAATGHDFPDPRDVVMRCVIGTASLHTMEQVRLQHTVYWNKMWQSDIVLEPKTTATPEEFLRVQRVRRAIRESLYVVYSSVRSGASSLFNIVPPGRTSRVDANLMDATGEILAGDDLWIMPILTILNPSLARTIIEFRYRELEMATVAATQLGYSGAKYPSVSDDSVVSGNSFGMAWGPASNSKLYNTALIALHAWNYYRVTMDVQFLEKVAYPILHGVASFVASRASVSESNSNAYDLVAVADVSGDLLINESFNVFVARMALTCAMEASYVLNVPFDPAWNSVRNGLAFTFLNGDVPRGVPNPYLNFQEGIDAMVFPSILLPLVPVYLNDLSLGVLGNSGSITASMYENALRFALENSIDVESFSANSVVCACIAHLAYRVTSSGRAAEVLSDADLDFEGRLGAVVSRIVDREDGEVGLNDAAAFLLLVVSGLTNAFIKGGVSPGKFAYSQMEVNAINSHPMPSSWASITVRARSKVNVTINSVTT